jgi:hypothetical protein
MSTPPTAPSSARPPRRRWTGTLRRRDVDAGRRPADLVLAPAGTAAAAQAARRDVGRDRAPSAAPHRGRVPDDVDPRPPAPAPPAEGDPDAAHGPAASPAPRRALTAEDAGEQPMSSSNRARQAPPWTSGANAHRNLPRQVVPPAAGLSTDSRSRLRRALQVPVESDGPLRVLGQAPRRAALRGTRPNGRSRPTPTGGHQP